MNAIDKTSIQEQQHTLPKGWVRTTVGTIFTVVGGGTPSTARADYWDGPIPWITSADIDDGGRISPRKNLTEKGITESATNRVPPGSVIVVTRVGLGKAGLAHAELCFSQDSQGLVFSDDHCFPPFVAYQMRFLVSIFKQISRGTTISGVTKKQLLDLGFTLPPYQEQHRIVAEIETQFTRLDAVVTAFKRVQANLKRYRASILQAACEGRLVPTEAKLARAEGRTYESADQLLQRILQECRVKWEAEQLADMQAKGKAPKDDTWKSKYKEPATPDTSELPELPEGWMWATVEQVGYVQLGRQRAPKYHYGEHMRPYLRVANVFEDRIDTADILHMNFTPAEFRTYSLQHGDILLNEGQSLELVGRPAMYRDEVPGVCFQNTLVRFRPYQGLTSEFALCVFRSYLHNGRFQRIAKWTTNIAHLGAGRFAELEFPLPPLTEQHRILAEVERRLSIIDELETTIATNLKRADRLRQAILKRAFEGKLVPQDPTDEPASMLLERIRLERERTTEKPKATPQQTKAPQPTGQPKATAPVQGELVLEFRQ